VRKRLSALGLALGVLTMALTGCDGPTVTPTVTVALKPDPFAVKRGMTKQQVRTLAGDPLVGSPPAPGRDCWFYAPSKKDITIHAIRFCFTNGRVSLIRASIPGSGG
jgi:outer membrane protein assembly factor BamE (lipoprotein component of BamABCDE complex)